MASIKRFTNALRPYVPRFKRGVRRNLLLTLEGILFIPLMSAVGFAAINTGANLLYLAFAMMAGLMTVSALASWINIRGLAVRRIVPDGISVGETARIGMQVVNRKLFFHSYSLRIIDILSNDKPAGLAFVFHSPVRKPIRVDYATNFDRRGLHRFNRVRVASRFPFGFTEKSISWLEPGEILVLPRVYPVGDFLERQKINLGDLESGRKGPGVSLFSLRDYNQEDSARSIHWKASARKGSLIVKEMESEEHKKVSLLLDNLAPAEDIRNLAEDFEKAVSCLSSISAELMNSGFQVEVLTRSGRVPFDISPSHLTRILRAMALIELIPRQKVVPHLPPPPPDSTMIWFDYGTPVPAGHDAIILNAKLWSPLQVTPVLVEEAV